MAAKTETNRGMDTRHDKSAFKKRNPKRRGFEDKIKDISIDKILKALSLEVLSLTVTSCFIWTVVLLMLVCIKLFYIIVDKESVLIVKDLGVQFTRSGRFGKETKQFIEQERIVDVIINEVITMHQVVFYLMLLITDDTEDNTKEKQKLFPLFTGKGVGLVVHVPSDRPFPSSFLAPLQNFFSVIFWLISSYLTANYTAPEIVLELLCFKPPKMGRNDKICSVQKENSTGKSSMPCLETIKPIYRGMQQILESK